MKVKITATITRELDIESDWWPDKPSEDAMLKNMKEDVEQDASILFDEGVLESIKVEKV